MSFAALGIVSKMRAGSAAEKLVALAYADRHNEDTGCAYPSLAWLCEFSSLNRKTVIAAVGRLEAAGFLSDSGARQGDTGQIKVYRLNLDTVPKMERFRKRNSSEKVAKESQKRDTDTVRTSSSPTIATQSTEKIDAAPPRLRPEHVVEAWNATATKCGLPVIRKLTAKRRQALNVRLREHPLEDWTEAIDAIARNRWMHGDNDRGWRADFNFLLRPDNFVKLIEGGYDRSSAKH